MPLISTHLNRRSFIKRSVATAALLPPVSLPSGLMRRRLHRKRAAIYRTDRCGPLVIAMKRSDENLACPTLMWPSSLGAATRQSGSRRRANGIDGAHILSPMPYLISTEK
jgi:hypothetical protein